MGTLVRKAFVSPTRAPPRLPFDFVPQDLLLSTLYTPPASALPPQNFDPVVLPKRRFNPGLYEVQQNYSLRTILNFRRIQRQVVVNPIPPKRALRFDFVPQNPLLNVSSTPPGNPVFQKDLSGPPSRAPRNGGLYDVIQNYSLRIQVIASVRPPFTPCLVDLQVPRAKWNPTLYEFNRSLALQSQTISFPPFAGLIAPAVRPIGRQGLLPVLEQNLLNTLLSGVGESPYIPIDVSDGRMPPRPLIIDHHRNIALFAGPALRPPQVPSPEFRYPPVRRIDYTIAVRGFLTSTVSSQPNFPLSQELPPRIPCWNPDLYAAYNQPMYRILASVKPPISYSSLEIRPRTVQSISPVQLQPVPFALLAPPTFVAGLSNISYNKNNGVQTYNTSVAFIGNVTSYSISPGLDAGMSFNTSTGVISTDTGVATVATHGPYTITATNGNGSTSSNAFTISIGSGNYHVDGPRVTLSTTALSATYGVSGPDTTRDKPNSEDLS